MIHNPFYLPRLMWAPVLAVLTLSCAADDDVCLSAEGTPRMKVKFKNFATDKIRSVDTIEVRAKYNGQWVDVAKKYGKTDSLLIPLDVAASTATDLQIRLSKKGTYSSLRMGYQMENVYVSPACGVKKNYQVLTATLENSGIVKKAELNQTSLLDENKTHLYLHF